MAPALAGGDGAARRVYTRGFALQDMGGDRGKTPRGRDGHDGHVGLHGPFEKFVARSFFFWMVRFLRTRTTT